MAISVSLELTALVAAAGSGVAAGVRYWLKRRTGKAKYVRLQLEVVAIRFDAYVAQGSVGVITITLQAMNYTDKIMALSDVAIEHLGLGGGPTLRGIPIVGDYEIPPCNSREVYCRRDLQDSESAQIRGVARRDVIRQGSAAIVARATVGRRRVQFRSPAVVVHGTIEGLPPSEPQIPKS